MALTVNAAVNLVVGRLAGKLSAVGLPVVTTSANAAVVDPLRKALGYVGLAPADPVSLADSDLAAIPAGGTAEKYFDAATLETLYVILGQCAKVDQTVGTMASQKLSQIAMEVRAMIAALEGRLRQPYGPNVPAASVTPTTNPPVPFMPNDPFHPFHTRSQPWQRWPYPQ